MCSSDLLRHLRYACLCRCKVVVWCKTTVLHIYTILLWLLQTETGIVDEIVNKDWLRCLLYPDRTTLLVLGTAPAAIDDGVVIGGHLRERDHLAIAGIRKLEGVGAGVVDDVVGYIELATRRHVDGLARLCVPTPRA